MLVHREALEGIPPLAREKVAKGTSLAVRSWLFSPGIPRMGKDDWCHLFVPGIAAVPPSRGLNWDAVGHGGSVFVPLTETSVESLLRATTHTLATLQVPREQLSEALEQIYSGTGGAIYRTSMYTGDPAKPKSVVLKALKGKRSVRLPFPFLLFCHEPLTVTARRLCRH